MKASANGVTVNGPLDESGVIEYWPKAEPLLSMALERDGYKLVSDDLLRQIADGLVGMYVVTDDETGEVLAALACEVNEYPQSVVFNIAYCGGRELDRWAELLGSMESEAVRQGCDTVRITGRAGWGRLFPDYREMNRVFERKVLVAA